RSCCSFPLGSSYLGWAGSGRGRDLETSPLLEASFRYYCCYAAAGKNCFGWKLGGLLWRANLVLAPPTLVLRAAVCGCFARSHDACRNHSSAVNELHRRTQEGRNSPFQEGENSTFKEA